MPRSLSVAQAAFVFVSITLAGCSKEVLTDVSSQISYRQIVGTNFEVIGRLDAYGIRDHSSAPVKYVTLIPPPGIAGSQIAFVREVPRGTKATVTHVLQSNRLLDPQMTLLVRIESTDSQLSIPARIDLFRGNEGKGAAGLNPSLYRKLEKE